MHIMEKHKISTMFFGFIISLYSLVDKIYGAAFIVLMGIQKMSPEEIGSIFAIGSLTLAIFDYPSGYISDKYGRKRMTIIGAIVWGLGMIGFAYSTNFIMFVVATVVMSLGLALYSGSPQAWYIDTLRKLDKFDYKNEVVPKLTGIASIFSIVGSCIASIVMNFSIETTVLIGGLTAVVTGLVFSLAGEENYGSATHEPIISGIVNSSKRFITDTKLMTILLRNILVHVSFIIFILSWQLYGVNKMGLKNEYVGIVMIGFMAVISIAGFIASNSCKAFGAEATSMIAAVISGAGFLVIWLSPSLIVFILGIAIYELGFGMEMSAYYSWIHDYINDSNRATFFSGMSALKSFAGFFITIAIGIMTAQIGYKHMWAVAAVFQLSSILIVYYLYQEKASKLVKCTEGQ